ncbi:hypothetical protein BDFB_010472 [Asbolus verrucosus]|uniref:Retropepsins domain-containing protein n=1 Tax=Asbolus verrucosus TaxID=1661398 RepID=A0A482VAZ5_ASBVE|nr:hypothetical protein BDFB_010472 [Asbolus verrucosus]
MAIQMTNEQFQALLQQIRTSRTERPPQSRHFTLLCTAKFDGNRSYAAVEEFITAITIFKTVEQIEDKDAITGLPLLLTGEANQWWKGVKDSIQTFDAAVQAIRNAFAPKQPNFRIFGEIFAHAQPEGISLDQYITIQRERFAQLSRPMDEIHKIRDRISRGDINSFTELLDRGRVIEATREGTKETTTRERYQNPVPLSFCYLNTNSIERPAVEITLGNTSGTAYLDSGAKTSLASQELYQVLKHQRCQFQNISVNLIQADGKGTPQRVKMTTAMVTLNKRKIPTQFIVIPNAPNAKTWLGIDFLQEAGLVIDYKGNRWHFNQGDTSEKVLSDTEIAKINAEMTSLPPVITPIRSPDISMDCDYESNLTDNYGPEYPSIMATALRHLSMLDSLSRSDYICEKTKDNP